MELGGAGTEKQEDDGGARGKQSKEEAGREAEAQTGSSLRGWAWAWVGPGLVPHPDPPLQKAGPSWDGHFKHRWTMYPNAKNRWEEGKRVLALRPLV